MLLETTEPSLFTNPPRGRRYGYVYGLVALVAVAVVGWQWKRHLTTPDAESPKLSWPETGWKITSPAAENLDESKLHAMAEFLGGEGCVTKDGRMAFHWGNFRAISNIGSARKPLQSIFLLEAVAGGRLASLETPVAEVLPTLKQLNPQLGSKDAAITWRHLLTQTSCYGVTEAPGMAFDYNDFQTALLFETMVGKVFGIDRSEVNQKILHPLLTEPLGCEDGPHYAAPADARHIETLRISPRDFCRIGLLMLRDGQWKGRRIVDAAHLHRMISDPLPASLPRTQGQGAEMLPGQRSAGGGKNQEEHAGSYSWMWWINGMDKNGARLWPDAPVDSYAAIGYGGTHAMVVIPSCGIVAAWGRAKFERQFLTAGGSQNVNRCLKLLAGSVAR